MVTLNALQSYDPSTQQYHEGGTVIVYILQTGTPKQREGHTTREGSRGGTPQHSGSRAGVLLCCAALSKGGVRRDTLGRKEEVWKTQEVVAAEQGFDGRVEMEKEARGLSWQRQQAA